MIVTAKNKIPLLWQFTIAAPWGTLRFKYMIIGSVFIFSLKKFIENPAGITFVMSIPYIMSILVAPICAFISDRIWTRFGRRKPFAIPSMIGVGIAFILMPLMPNIWGLLFAYFLYQVLHDFGNGAGEILKQEVVPPKQRGTAAAIGTWIWNIGNLSFNLIAIGRFDDYKYYAGFPINGEQSIYWGIGAAIITMAMVVAFGVKETYQPSKFRGEKFTLRNVLGGLLNRNLWPVYLLITGWIVSNAGLGSLTPLLYVEQWGFTKQEMGINIAVGTSINMFLIILIGWFADRLPRMKTFEIVLFLCILIELSFYLYVEFILFDKTPTLPEIIIFGEMASIAGILLGMLYMPLVFDYVPRNEMGTFTAGSNLVQKCLHVITLNGVGIFIAVYSTLFMPPGGDMARISLAERVPEQVVQQQLITAGIGDAGAELDVSAWYATNAAWEEGTAFEIRLENPESLDLKDSVEDLNNDLKVILAKKNNAEAQAEQASLKGDAAAVESALYLATRQQELADPIESDISRLETQQQTAADAFLERIKAALGEGLMTDGDQVLAAFVEPVTIFRIPMNGRADSGDIARTLNQMRLSRPELVDLVLLNEGMDFYLEASVRGEKTEPAYISDLAGDLQRIGESRIGELLRLPVEIVDSRIEQSVVLDLKSIEDPLNNYVSPITRFIYGIWDWVGDPPTPERRIWATARVLRDLEHSPHVGAWDLTENTDFAFRLQAVYSDIPQPAEGEAVAPSDAAALARIAELLGQNNPLLPAAMDLFQRAVPGAAQNRITIPTPVLEARFAPPKYDYMSGYLYMVIMSTVGLGICLFFTRRERKGLIRKRGREESEEEARAEAALKDSKSGMSESQRQYYVPGYVPQKIFMLICGFAMFGFGMVKMGPDLMLLATGKSADAIATRVVKDRIGGSSTSLYSDAEIKGAHERFDRTWVFWNHFAFETGDGKIHEFRSPTGKQLEPEYTLLDQDGLPTTVTVFYDPENPDKVVIPAHFSTWFLSGLLVLFGSLVIIFGGILLYYARKPIELPLVLPKDAPAETA
jgi:MFS family permease